MDAKVKISIGKLLALLMVRKELNNKKVIQKVVNAIKVALLIFIVAFFSHYINNNWATFYLALIQLPAYVVVLSIVLMTTGNVIRGFLWAPLRFELTSYHMSLWEALYVSSVSRMGRYIPGKVWSLVAKASLSSSSEKELPYNAAAVFFETLFFETSLLTFGALAYFLSGYYGDYVGFFYYPVIILLSLVLIICVPLVFVWCTNKVLFLFNYPLIINKVSYIKLLTINMGNWLAILLWAWSFIILTETFTNLDSLAIIGLAGIYAISWFLGFVVIIAPAGIGIRESVAVFGLQTIADLSFSQALVIVLTARFISISAELMSIIIGLPALLLKNKLHL